MMVNVMVNMMADVMVDVLKFLFLIFFFIIFTKYIMIIANDVGSVIIEFITGIANYVESFITKLYRLLKQ